MNIRKFVKKVLNLYVRLTTKSEQWKEETTCHSLEEKKRQAMEDRLKAYLYKRYVFRYNVLTEQPEYRLVTAKSNSFLPVDQRALNTFCIDAHRQHIGCWDKDVSRLLCSQLIEDYHPFLHYMAHLPEWDGVDRVIPLAKRISQKSVWINGFHRWLLGVAAQWSGQATACANAVAPMLVSGEQGKRKSTFCRLLMPPQLLPYYLDKFDLTSESGCEQKLSRFGLINLDEFDRYGASRMPVLKNLMQMTELNFRKAHQAAFTSLPRMTSFIGTSNQHDLLTDPTGSRRFICAEVNEKIDCTVPDHAQLFAQLKAELACGERYWFSAEEEKEIQANNRDYYYRSAEQELVVRCFRTPEMEEEGELYTATDLFNWLCKHFPSAMRGTTPARLGRSLTALGMKHVHSARGSVYRLVLIDN